MDSKWHVNLFKNRTDRYLFKAGYVLGYILQTLAYLDLYNKFGSELQWTFQANILDQLLTKSTSTNHVVGNVPCC